MGKEKNPRRVADNEAFAVSKMLRTSPQKLNLVAALIRNKPVDKALADLTFSKKRVSDAVKKTLKKGGTVSLVGFGTFAVGRRAARTGRNPRTGDTIKIKAAKVPKFRPGKALKDALN